jgi:CHAD domain-containing protein
VHQIRVAVRRLRAALALFKQHLNPITLGRFNDELRGLGSLFGAAPDWDVFVLETPSAAEKGTPALTLLDPLRKAAEGKRLAAHHTVCTELSAASFARLVIGIAASIADGTSDLQRKEDNALKAPIAGVLRPICSIGWREKWPSEAGIWTRRPVSNCTPYGRLSKKLRYSVEFLSALYPRKGVKPYLRPCKSLQKLLAAATGRKATQHAAACYGDIQAIRTAGITSFNGIAGALNERGIATPRGTGAWTATAVRRTLARLEATA